MPRLFMEAETFKLRTRQFEQQARQTAAFFLISGVDLAHALAATGEERVRLTRRVSRLIERERLKGMRRHWSYDLNRHIALKQALDRLRGGDAGETGNGMPTGEESGGVGKSP